jgi:hypothetical protein
VPPKLWKVLSTHYNPSQLYAIKYVSELESTASTVQEATSSNSATATATDDEGKGEGVVEGEGRRGEEEE